MVGGKPKLDATTTALGSQLVKNRVMVDHAGIGDSTQAGDRLLTRRGFLSDLFWSAAIGFAAPLSEILAAEKSLLAEAAELAREAVTVDLHCHPNSLRGSHFPKLDPEVPANMKTGGLDAAVFAVRGDYPLITRDISGRRYERRPPRKGELFGNTQRQLDGVLEAIGQQKLLLARSPAETVSAKKQAKPCAVLAIEGSDPLEGDLSRVKLFYDRGVRVLQLVHYRINEIGDIQTESARHNGLTPFGREVVREMNRLGMVIDTAHGSSDTIVDVLKESRFPVIFSHTGSYALRRLSRHLEDKDMRAIATKGGIVGIWPHLRRRDTLEQMLGDIDHARKLMGTDHVGIATDLFGLEDHTAIPTHKEFTLISAALLKRGYGESDVVKIVGGNFMRLLREVAPSAGL
jgi:membrane dipeptidase